MSAKYFLVGISGFIAAMALVTVIVVPYNNDDTGQTNKALSDAPVKTINALDMDQLALKIHFLVNEERTQRGLEPLQWNEKLADIAKDHSKDMATRYYFEHDSPEGYDFDYRYQQSGFNCRIPLGTNSYSVGAENLAYFNKHLPGQDIVKQTVDSWLNSKTGHRESMLNSLYDEQGIGVAESKHGQLFVTQNFC